jgi:ribosomal protein S18 acetylase RimI-like enzyme
MNITKVDNIKEANVLFELENRALNRDFDLRSANVQQQIEYLRGSEIYILYDEREPVGFFAFRRDSSGIEARSIVVVPEKQGKGYGKEIMKKLLELANGNNIRLVTHPKNRIAIAYYLKSGFEIYGWKENYYGDGEPRLLLRRTG